MVVSAGLFAGSVLAKKPDEVMEQATHGAVGAGLLALARTGRHQQQIDKIKERLGKSAVEALQEDELLPPITS